MFFWKAQGVVFYPDDPVQFAHGCFIQVFPYHISGKEQPGFRMVDDVMDVVGFKFVEDRYG